MKKLWLIRHAKSDWSNPELIDNLRGLNKRGLRDAPLMANEFANKGEEPELILSSKAIRAFETAKAFANLIDYPYDLIEMRKDLYMTSFLKQHKVLSNLSDKYDKVALFGHNPVLTYLAMHYYPQLPLGKIPTCGIVCLTFDVKKWKKIDQDGAKLQYVDYPKNYAWSKKK